MYRDNIITVFKLKFCPNNINKLDHCCIHSQKKIAVLVTRFYHFTRITRSRVPVVIIM